MTAVTVRSDFGAQGNKICHRFNFSPFYLPLAYELNEIFDIVFDFFHISWEEGQFLLNVYK